MDYLFFLADVFFIKLIETLVEKGKMDANVLSFFFLLALKEMREPMESFMKRKRKKKLDWSL